MKIVNRQMVTTSRDLLAQGLEALSSLDDELHFKLWLNSYRIANPINVKTIVDILQMEPSTRFVLDLPNVDCAYVADHLNGRIGSNDKPPLVSLNSLLTQMEQVDVSLVQCFFGQDESQVRAVTLALKFMSLSNPRPREWVFVEAQRSKAQTKFDWVATIGAKYIFVPIQNDRQDYFIKEQLWNIGAKNCLGENLVFVDGDVAYCQTDWLAYVERTFDNGCQLFQPHAWSWRANELEGDIHENDLGLMESFASMRKRNAPLCDFNGHTGYDIAISRCLYGEIKGFPALVGTGGDFLLWSLFWTSDKTHHPWKTLIHRIESLNGVHHMEPGCSELICFHNHHGKLESRHREYKFDCDRIKTDPNPERFVANNYERNDIVEVNP